MLIRYHVIDVVGVTRNAVSCPSISRGRRIKPTRATDKPDSIIVADAVKGEDVLGTEGNLTKKISRNITDLL